MLQTLPVVPVHQQMLPIHEMYAKHEWTKAFTKHCRLTVIRNQLRLVLQVYTGAVPLR